MEPPYLEAEDTTEGEGDATDETVEGEVWSRGDGAPSLRPPSFRGPGDDAAAEQ
jgi:hypothetical protein